MQASGRFSVFGCQGHQEVTGRSLGAYWELTGSSLGGYWELTGRSPPGHLQVTTRPPPGAFAPSLTSSPSSPRACEVFPPPAARFPQHPLPSSCGSEAPGGFSVFGGPGHQEVTGRLLGGYWEVTGSLLGAHWGVTGEVTPRPPPGHHQVLLLQKLIFSPAPPHACEVFLPPAARFPQHPLPSSCGSKAPGGFSVFGCPGHQEVTGSSLGGYWEVTSRLPYESLSMSRKKICSPRCKRTFLYT